jgi:2-methylcitrate dehydratase PrpD
MAAAAGVEAAQLAAAGATVALDRAASGFARAFGGSLPGDGGEPAIRRNWIKPWPCCLGTHSTIEAVSGLRGRSGSGEWTLIVTVHPLERKAAMIGDPATGLGAKFSIPYLAEYTWLYGPPGLGAFAGVDEDARALARDRVTVVTDDALGEWEARVSIGDDGPTVCVETALGSPERPLDADSLAAKVRELAGDRLDGALDDPARPVAEILTSINL